METNTEKFYSLGDIFNALKLFSVLIIKKWWLIVIMGIIGAISGFIYDSFQKSKFEAVCTFILEEKQSGMGGLGSIASQFGFDIGSVGGGGGLFAGDNILDILKSKKVVEQVLLSKSLDSGSNTLADLYLNFSGLKKNWSKNSALSNINMSNVIKDRSQLQDSVLNILYERVIKNHLVAERISKKGTIISVKVVASNTMFAKLMSERLVEEASKLYLNIKVGTSLSNIQKMQRRSDSLLTLLNGKSYVVAASQPLDLNPGIRTAMVATEIGTRDKSVLSALYSEVTKNLEASKMLLSQQTPVIQLLDKPGLSLKDKKKSILFLTVVGAAISFVITIGIMGLLFISTYKKEHTYKHIVEN